MAKDRSDDKFNKILNAAIHIIARKGFHNTKVKDIADKAGVASGTVYNYFSNKEDILISIMIIKLNEYVTKAKNAIEEIDDPKEKLKILIHHHFEAMQTNPELALVLQFELRQPTKDIRDKIRKYLREYFKFIEEIIKDGVEKGVFAKDLNVYFAREMFFGTLDEIVSTWVYTKKDWLLTDQTDTICGMLIKAYS
ncbi:TetR/AcrR family transcriptional regulator [Calditerrivibrio nitroreducens]|uniref:Transcriptional regulator, TetR family n=1 Tax=Calditerrivibrio nitroreducens (strain DSM 19672 / NBRC 101217 / Yu37-1) TaxID=768670 RepID=E4TK00_CALNY|nr:TetR/AcrR family transcriptional regulator [Calditerrivibrio nitroreducens]ADR18251.1 transcriptional regulator, TetR family [Calditerrivibrio nitroreducens DSM 19672]